MAQEEELANFCRLASLVTDVGSDALRDVLIKIIYPDSLATLFQKNMNILIQSKKNKIIFQEQYNLLTKSSPVPAELDITLLTFIFRNVCSNVVPANGWHTQPGVNDVGLGDDLFRLKNIRNVVFAHCTSTRVPSAGFTKLWTEIEDVIVRISKHGSLQKQQDILQRINTLRHQDLDPQSQTNKSMKMLLEWKEQDDRTLTLERMDKQDAKLDEIHHLLTDVKATISDAKLDEIHNLLTDVKATISIKDNDSAAMDRIESDDRIAGCSTCGSFIRIQVNEASETDQETLERGPIDSEYLKQLWVSCIKLYPWLKAEMGLQLTVCIASRVLNQDNADSIKACKRCIAVDELLKHVLQDWKLHLENFLKKLELHCEPISALKRKLNANQANDDKELKECLCRNEDLNIACRIQQPVRKQDLCQLQRDHKGILPYRINDIETLSALNDGFLSAFYFSLVDHDKVGEFLRQRNYSGGASRLIEIMEKSSKTIMKDFCKILASIGKQDLVKDLKLKEKYCGTEALPEKDTLAMVLFSCIVNQLARLRNYTAEIYFAVKEVFFGSIVFHLYPMKDNAWNKLEESCSSGRIKGILEIIFPDENILSYFSDVDNKLHFSIFSETHRASNYTVEQIAVLKLDLISGDSSSTEATVDFEENPIERSLETLCEELEICGDILTRLRDNDLVPEDIMHKLRQTPSRASAIRCLMKNISPPGKGYRIIKEYAKKYYPYLYQELNMIDEDQSQRKLLFQCEAQTKRNTLGNEYTLAK